MKSLLFILAALFVAAPVGLRADQPGADASAQTRKLTDQELAAKLKSITIPRVSINGEPLSQALKILDEISTEDDGVKFLFPSQAQKDPLVTILLRNQTMDRVLDFVCESVGYQWQIKQGVIVVSERPPTKSGSISGQILNASTGHAVKGVQVKLIDHANQSNSWSENVKHPTTSTN